MSKIYDNKTINERPIETICLTSEDENASTQRSALLGWFENCIKKQVPYDYQAEFWRIVGNLSAEALADKYFPTGVFSAEFWMLANTLEDDEFYPLITSMFEDTQLSKSPVDPETVYGKVSYERLRFVLMNHYYDLDAGAPFFARAHYDGVYANEFPVDYKRALEMLLRYTEISGNTTKEFERLFTACGMEAASRLLADLIAADAVGAFIYLAQNSSSEIEVCVIEKALNLSKEYGLSKVKENFDLGYVIDTHGNLLRYFGNDSTITVPEGTTCIAAYAFPSNAHTIRLPKTVVEIGDMALANFQNIYIAGNIKNIGYGGLGTGPSLTEVGPVITVYAPSDAHTVAEYCKENDIIFVVQ